MREWTDDDGNKIFDVSKLYYGEEKFEVSYTTIKETVNRTESELDNVKKNIGSIDLVGEQIFKSIQNQITPDSITISSICRNGAKIKNWYIDNEINTDYVSDDNSSITIPADFMDGKNSITIKAESNDGSLFDLHTIYLLSDSTGADGQAAISIIISSDKGLSFDENTTVTETICTCTVFEGVNEIEPKSYNWLSMWNDMKDWESIGDEKTIAIPIDKTIARRRLICEVDIDI